MSSAEPADVRPLVICLDDEPAILRSLRRLLADEPYELILCVDPKEALELIKNRDVSVALVDFRMPQTTGAEFLQAVALLSPRTRRILFTGYPRENGVLSGVGTGLFQLVEKPWDDQKLKGTIRQALATAAP